ncbi:type I restriction enzyme, S subunit [Lutibacter oricola]|uniref:Type I restriction enzyme, S subunit n=1 Tax=Lutibacter oricola TaxID=762486 RepID=A0A1H3CL19_9FLAO|nr:restriction endonuclease subunit S [Lutibacter oricola]SDX54851.1 type I restriction enzyme, S subunit [Lutibacter oricola]
MEVVKKEIPGGWEKDFGYNYFNVQGGYAFKSNDYQNEGVLLVRIGNVGNGDFVYKDVIYVPNRFLKSHSNFLLNSGDVLMGLTGDLGKICILENGDFPFILNQRVGKFNCKKINNKYLQYLLSSQVVQNNLDSLFAGGAQKNISPVQIEKLEYILPKSKTEQQKIAEVLSKVDRAIEETKQIIAKYQRIKTGLMQDLLTKGIDENGNIRSEETHQFKDSPLGRIPVEWECIQLEYCKRKNTTITYGIVQTYEHIEDGIPVLRTIDLNKDGINSVDKLLRTKKSISDKFKRTILEENDIVCNVRASVGDFNLVGKEYIGCNTTRGVARIVPKSEINNSFLTWFLKSYTNEKQMELLIKGTTFIDINIGDLRKIWVLLPNLISEQNDISDKLDKISSIIYDTDIELKKLQKIKTGLMQDLLSGKKRVTNLL